MLRAACVSENCCLGWFGPSGAGYLVSVDALIAAAEATGTLRAASSRRVPRARGKQHERLRPVRIGCSGWSRYLSHVKPLSQMGKGLARFYERIEPLTKAKRLDPWRTESELFLRINAV